MTRFAPFASLAMLGVILLSTPALAATSTPPPPAVAAPADVTVVPGNGKVTLMWSPVPGAEGYRIYRGVNGTWISTPVGRTVVTTHTSYGLANGTTYSFTVAAYTKEGNGPLSLSVSAMPIAPPQAVTAAAGDGRVTIKWELSTGATSYTIYRKAEGEAEFSELTTGVMTPPFVDPGLTNGTRYSYLLAATTAASHSDFSAKVSAIPVPPPPKSGPAVTVVAGNGKVTLSWSEVPGAPGYNIYRSTTGAFIGGPIASTNETTFKNGGLANDTTYFYTVAAKNIGGEGPRAPAVAAVPVAAPLAPQNPSAIPVNKQMALSWAPSTGATTYTIYRSTLRNRQANVRVATAVGGTRFIDTTVVDGQTYFYRITASNDGGESPRSTEVAARLGAPAQLMAAGVLAAVDFCDSPYQARPGMLVRLWQSLSRRERDADAKFR
ncbi:MAG TPA: fibronectin type III domain-containing protein [Vicinamibacterales bacterium]|nr:fibronectin type III domain-containing protein [Vicinamibacterales bacterium]